MMNKLLFLIMIFSCACGNEENTNNNHSGNAHERNQEERATEPTTILNDLLQYENEAALKVDFPGLVSRSEGYLPEGMGAFQQSVLYEGTPDEVHIVWNDDQNFRDISYVQITGKESRWHTGSGIRLGSSLADLEGANEKPFQFYGFQWDYAGAVDWDGGKLADTKMTVFLSYPEGSELPSSLIGDSKVSSEHPDALKVQTYVNRIKLEK